MAILFLCIFVVLGLLSLLYVMQLKKETFNTSACAYNTSVPCINRKKNMPLTSGNKASCVLYKVENC